MLDLLRDPVWQFVGVILTLLGVAVAFWIYWLQRQTKELAFGLASSRRLLSIADELDSGRVQAARIINPELRRYVTLALPKQGQITPAGRIVSKLIAECASDWNREIAKPDGSPAPAKTRTKR